MIYRKDNWKRGDPCPICGSSKLMRELVYRDRVRSEDGSMSEIDIEQDNVHKRKIECDKCGTVLLKSPSQ